MLYLSRSHLHRQRGFCPAALVLLMPIFSFLAGIFAPAWQAYLQRISVSEGLSLTEDVRAAVTGHYVQSGNWPVDYSAVDRSATVNSQLISRIAVSRGTNSTACSGRSDNCGKILITFSDVIPDENERVLPLVGIDDGDFVRWYCQDIAETTLNPLVLPEPCR